MGGTHHDMLYKKRQEKRGKEERREEGREEQRKKHKAREKWVCGVYVHITLSTTVSDTLCVPLEIK